MQAIKTKVGLGVLAGVLALGLAACGGGTPAPTVAPTSAGNAANGETLFIGTCSACHGPDATGITGLGKNLRTSPFVAGQTDEALLKFIQTGRPASDDHNIVSPFICGHMFVGDSQKLTLFVNGL